MAKGPKPKPAAVRFWAKVVILGPDECWLWTAAADDKGYGRFGLGSLGIDRRTELSHRVAWWLTFGEWPTLCLLHRCDTPGCCNPKHLFEGTIPDNNADMCMKGRQCRGPVRQLLSQGEENGNALLTDEDILAIRAASGRLVDIGDRFGIHFTTVSDIRRRKSWRHIAEAV